ncbi:hypothetical protein K438DRAFT_1976800 [Mycena galopus ATCC 62051]|nr:hypothetical protein K438DRAFT_1976800 [Mycena galopus ATCC 62051]
MRAAGLVGLTDPKKPMLIDTNWGNKETNGHVKGRPYPGNPNDLLPVNKQLWMGCIRQGNNPIAFLESQPYPSNPSDLLLVNKQLWMGCVRQGKSLIIAGDPLPTGVKLADHCKAVGRATKNGYSSSVKIPERHWKRNASDSEDLGCDVDPVPYEDIIMMLRKPATKKQRQIKLEPGVSSEDESDMRKAAKMRARISTGTLKRKPLYPGSSDGLEDPQDGPSGSTNEIVIASDDDNDLPPAPTLASVIATRSPSPARSFEPILRWKRTRLQLPPTATETSPEQPQCPVDACSLRPVDAYAYALSMPTPMPHRRLRLRPVHTYILLTPVAYALSPTPCQCVSPMPRRRLRSGDTIQELETSWAKRVKAMAEISWESAIIAAHSHNDEGFQQIFVWKATDCDSAAAADSAAVAGPAPAPASAGVAETGIADPTNGSEEVRWSELLQLPYCDETRMCFSVVDHMPHLLKGMCQGNTPSGRPSVWLRPIAPPCFLVRSFVQSPFLIRPRPSVRPSIRNPRRSLRLCLCPERRPLSLRTPFPLVPLLPAARTGTCYAIKPGTTADHFGHILPLVPALPHRAEVALTA